MNEKTEPETTSPPVEAQPEAAPLDTRAIANAARQQAIDAMNAIKAELPAVPGDAPIGELRADLAVYASRLALGMKGA